MKIYFAKKPDHTNINGIFYPRNILKKTVQTFNKRYFGRQNYFTMGYNHDGNSMQEIIGSFGKIHYDPDHKMYYVEATALNFDYREIFHISFIDCAAHGNMKNKIITELAFYPQFFLLLAENTNVTIPEKDSNNAA